MNLLVAERFIIKNNAEVRILREGLSLRKVRIGHVVVDADHRAFASAEVAESILIDLIHSLLELYVHGSFSISKAFESLVGHFSNMRINDDRLEACILMVPKHLERKVYSRFAVDRNGAEV